MILAIQRFADALANEGVKSEIGLVLSMDDWLRLGSEIHRVIAVGEPCMADVSQMRREPGEWLIRSHFVDVRVPLPDEVRRRLAQPTGGVTQEEIDALGGPEGLESASISARRFRIDPSG